MNNANVFLLPSTFIAFGLALLTACSGGGIEEFSSPEEAAAHYERLSRDYAQHLVDGNLKQAWNLTSRELRHEMGYGDFKDKHAFAYRQWGKPERIVRVHADTLDPAVLIEEIMRFPAKVSPENRRAVTVTFIGTDEGELALWLYFSGALGKEEVSAVEFGYSG